MRPLLILSIALATGIWSETASQLGPDVSGRWVREPGNVPGGGGGNAGWGPNIEIEQLGNELTVRSAGKAPTRYKADGTEVVESLAKAPCYEQSRITKTVATDRAFTITTWLMTRTTCYHGEVRLPTDDPEATSNPGAGRIHGAAKRLESVTTVARVGGQLTVDATTPAPNGTTRSSSSTYRK